MKRGLIILAFFFILPTVLAFCGDGLVDPNGKENCQTCPEDNPCFVDQECREGICASRLVPPLFLKEDPSASIIISKDITNTLNDLYAKNAYEFVACLKGKYADGIYQIDEIEFPDVIEEGHFSIVHVACPRFGTISTIHSHSINNCKLSDIDIFAFGSKNEPTNSIMCGIDNFAFYSRKDFDKRMNYIIRDIQVKNYYFWFYFPWLLSIILLVIIGMLFAARFIKRKKWFRNIIKRN